MLSDPTASVTASNPTFETRKPGLAPPKLPPTIRLVTYDFPTVAKIDHIFSISTLNCARRHRSECCEIRINASANQRASRKSAIKHKITANARCDLVLDGTLAARALVSTRSEEHTSELQSRRDLVCRLLLEKKNK